VQRWEQRFDTRDEYDARTRNVPDCRRTQSNLETAFRGIENVVHQNPDLRLAPDRRHFSRTNV